MDDVFIEWQYRSATPTGSTVVYLSAAVCAKRATEGAGVNEMLNFADLGEHISIGLQSVISVVEQLHPCLSNDKCKVCQQRN